MKSHMLFFVYGASGSGKSTILNMVVDLSDNISIHKKDTTRSKRPLEEGKVIRELNFVDKFEEEDYVLTYEQFDNFYGIRKDLLLQSMEKQEIHFIICGNINVIKELKLIYPYGKSIYIHYSPEEIPKRFLDRDSLEFEKRKLRINEQYKSYINNSNLFDHVILNLWELENAKIQMGNILSLYTPNIQL